ncbi:exocyst complex component Sec6 [Cantharellus anzutake]|uniref:exocyst complex component Sec6 n=1 Tax=Cantharellus anzutake TaxID=1750568 RepID=UPI0019084B22|nr:exocyst complex component Sec6 [Cantharellus anzutake]KAF8329478.1 exocyst complex component Sec6 [Cantharellus anzutake]
MASSHMTPAQMVGEFLQSPDDLMKLAAFRKKLEKEKASIDAKLKSGVKDQLEATREGLRKLLQTKSHVQSIRDELQNVETMFNGPTNNIKTFDQISRVSMVHRNFVQTEEVVNNLTEMYSRLDTVEAQLEASREDILGPAPYILTIHYRLNQLEAFRNQTLHQAKRASADVRNTLKNHFSRLDGVIQSFDEYIIMMGENLLEIARAGYPNAIVKLVKIVEIEGKEDEKAVSIRLVKKAAKIDAAAKFKSIAAESRRLKHYRANILQKVTETINRKVQTAYEESLANGKGEAGFLDTISWMYTDLLQAQSLLTPCFPADWDIYGQYVRKYHKAVDGVIRRIVASNPEASTLLALHAFLKQYKKDMKELASNPEWVTPALLDGSEQSLIDDYVSLILRKLSEWSKNIMQDERKVFITRDESPEEDADGLYGMQRTVILFQMVNQQVDLALDSGQGAVLAKVVTEVSRVLRGMQDTWSRLVDSELKKQVDAKPGEEVPGGLVDYIIALANDQIRSADNCEALSARIEELVSEKYRVVIRNELNTTIDGYVEVVNRCTQSLVTIAFNDIKPATKQLFNSPQWYDGTLATQIVETLKDYMNDYQSFLNPSILDLLIENFLDNFLVTYLTALHRTSKLKMPAAADRIKEDIALTYDFFAQILGPNKRPEELERQFEIIEMCHALLTASKNLVFLSFWSFAKVHGPNLTFVEGLMKARDDLDRSAVNQVMESVKRKVKEEGLGDPPEPTIMKKIVMQSILSTFLSR